MSGPYSMRGARRSVYDSACFIGCRGKRHRLRSQDITICRGAGEDTIATAEVITVIITNIPAPGNPLGNWGKPIRHNVTIKIEAASGGKMSNKYQRPISFLSKRLCMMGIPKIIYPILSISLAGA